MSEQSPEGIPRGIGERIWDRLRSWQPRHRVSLFLMLAMTVALFLGVGVVQVRDDAKSLAWFLMLYFVFFLIVIGRAMFEVFDIVREHMREREAIFRNTIAEEEFTAELGRRVEKSDSGSWPE